VKYARPASVQEAVDLLTAHPGARPLAGGQSLVNVLKLRVSQVDALIDISALEELRTVNVAADGALQVGAGLRYVELASHPLVLEHQPMVAEVAGGLVDVQVRNRGTLGGNICFNDPTSNFPPLLVALGATVHLAGPEPRDIAADDFFAGPYRCALAPGELVRAVSFPALNAEVGVGYQTLQLARDSWALARAVARIERNGTVRDARVVIACLGPRPARHPGIEALLNGSAGDAGSVEAAMAAEIVNVDSVGDSHASAEYRLEMARVYARRAIQQALGHTEELA
jgi:aerobic carbon-monoxide dehydrogenase medium subunit